MARLAGNDADSGSGFLNPLPVFVVKNSFDAVNRTRFAVISCSADIIGELTFQPVFSRTWARFPRLKRLWMSI
jgi:hypothetical protein